MKIAIATCAGRDDTQAADAPLIAALESRGAQVQTCIWTDSRPLWHRFDAVIIRTTWDWHHNAAAFVDWVDRVRLRTRLINPPETIGWGLDKRFLLDLAASDAAVVPTLALVQPDVARVRRWAAERGFARLVLKPSLSAGSRGVQIVDAAALDTALAQDWPEQGIRLVQPYFSSIETGGELSLVYFGDDFSHAVRKRPKAGDFRVQHQYGGSYEACTPPPEARRLAERALAAIPGNPVIARLDMVADDAGALRLIEAEVVEPDLYFGVAPEAAGQLATCILKRLGS